MSYVGTGIAQLTEIEGWVSNTAKSELLDEMDESEEVGITLLH